MHKDTIAVARAALDYIDALPKDVVASLPAMPGFDRDWAENVLAAGVPTDVLAQVAPVDRRFMLDVSAVEPPPADEDHITRVEQRLTRSHLRDEATALLQQAEGALLALVESYTEERDGTFSACHPHNGFASVHQQLIKLRKSLSKAKV